MARPTVALPERFRYSRSLRRRVEGSGAERVSRRDAGRHRPRHPARTMCWPARWSWRPATGTFPPAPCSWRWSIRVSARRAAGLRPRRATTGSSRPTTACCRPSSTTPSQSGWSSSPSASTRVPRSAARSKGGDRFAPAAGWLAKGIALSSLGKTIQDFRLLDLPEPTVTADEVTGEVVRVDRFGNLITNIDRRTFEHLSAGGGISVKAGTQDIARVVAHLRRGAGGRAVRVIRQHRPPGDRGERGLTRRPS